MKTIHITAATLLIAFAVVPAASVGLAQQQIPLDFSTWSKPRVACTPFEVTLEARSTGAWSLLNIVPVNPPARIDPAQAELERIGGARLVLEIDANELGKEMLERSRDDVRRLLREARIGATVTIRADTIEVQPGNIANAPGVVSAIRPLSSGPNSELAIRNVDTERAVRGLSAFGIRDEAIAERRQLSEQASADILERRLRDVGVEHAVVQALGGGRILVIAPGLKEPERLFHLLHSTARLTFRIADPFADPCTSPAAPPEDSKVLNHHVTKTSLLVKRHVVAGGEDLVAVAVALDGRTRDPAVAFRFRANARSRLKNASAANIGQTIAIVLDGEVIDAPIIREQIADGAVQLSGGLTLQRANDLALLLRAGTLPSRLTIIERQIVEPRR
jgi:preprotein translocase subunit SecD